MKNQLLLPSDSTSILTAKQRLLDTIANHPMDNLVTIKCLTAIVLGTQYTEESEQKVEKLGLEIAKEMYYYQTINWEFGAEVSDPENPDNWVK